MEAVRSPTPVGNAELKTPGLGVSFGSLGVVTCVGDARPTKEGSPKVWRTVLGLLQQLQ